MGATAQPASAPGFPDTTTSLTLSIHFQTCCCLGGSQKPPVMSEHRGEAKVTHQNPALRYDCAPTHIPAGQPKLETSLCGTGPPKTALTKGINQGFHRIFLFHSFFFFHLLVFFF